MKPLQKRMEELMRHMNWSVPDVARVAQVSRAAVYQWVSPESKVKTIARVDVAEKLSLATGFSAVWLARGEGPKYRADSVKAASQWPFTRIDESLVRMLSDEELQQLETAIIISAGHLGLRLQRN